MSVTTDQIAAERPCRPFTPELAAAWARDLMPLTPQHRAVMLRALAMSYGEAAVQALAVRGCP